MTTTSSAVAADPVSVAVRSLHAMADGDRASFDLLYHPQAVDRENRVQPPSSRVPGPDGFYSTALWLRAAFAGPPTNKTFAVTQSHWLRIEDGTITEHWDNRDDIGMSKQLGWIPPTPAYLLKMARAKRRAKRS